MTNFYKNYVSLCAQKKKSASAVAVEVGLSRTSPNGWKKGKNPSDINLKKIADYFGVTVEYLLDEHSGEKEKSPTPEGVELDPVTKELFEIVESSDEDERKALLEMARLIKKRRIE